MEKDRKNILDIYKVDTYSNLAAIIPDRKLAKSYAFKAYNILQNSKEEFRNDISFINAATILAEFYFAEKNYSEAEKIILSGYEYAKVNYPKNILSFSNYLYLYGDIAAVKNKDYDTCIKYSKIIIDELAKLDASSSNLVKPRILKWSCHSSKLKRKLLSMNYTKL